MKGPLKGYKKRYFRAFNATGEIAYYVNDRSVEKGRIQIKGALIAEHDGKDTAKKFPFKVPDL